MYFWYPPCYMYYDEQLKLKVKCCSYIQSLGILYPTLSCDLSLCKLPNICAMSAAAYRISACPPPPTILN